MSTQQDIYTTDSENRPLMLNKENYVLWSSRLLWYAKSRTNGKLIYNSIMNSPYVRRMIPEPGDADREVTVNETFHEQTDDELTEKELKPVKADDQAIQTILLGLPGDIYAIVDSCETAQEIWFTSTDWKSIESYYYRFSKLMNDFKRNKHFPEKIASNLKFLNNLQPEWSRHVTIVVQNAVQNPSVKNVGNRNGLIVVSGIANQNPNGNHNVVAARAEGNAIGNNEAGIQLQAKEFDLMAAASDLDEIEETDKAPVYDSDGSAKVYNYDNCYDNEIFNMFTQEEQYTELLEPILEPHQVQQNDTNVISKVCSGEQDGGTIDQHPTTVEETRAYFESLYNNLAIKVEKVNTVNRKLKETNADLTTELARYKKQEKCFEISQEKYDKLEWCYQKSIYQEQCLTKKINALHLSFGKQITTLNEEISNLNNQLSKEKSIVSSLLEEKKNLKFDFKIYEDEHLDKQI
ncbi:hypothetical protein Tco_1398890 [Tanacetum coccineum]